jgi:uncharacterized protein
LEYLKHPIKKKKEGYKFIGNVSLTIESTYSVYFANKLIATLKNDSLFCYYSIGFKFSEKQKSILRQKAILMAIEDAKEKAQSIAESANVKLIRINSIIYKDDDNVSRIPKDRDIIKDDIWITQEMKSIGQSHSLNSKYQTFDFNPKEVEIEKSIQIEWAIKDK